MMNDYEKSLITIAVIFVAALIFAAAIGTVEPKFNNDCPPAKECVCKINEKG